MSILRKDPVSNGWVIIAEERALRPHDFVEPPAPVGDPATCPFCEGHERLTPHEITALRPGGGPPDGPGWRVRVIPNKYAALRVEGDLERRGVGMYDEMRGVGAHEVVIETPDHAGRMHSYDEAHLADVVRVCHGRVCDLSRDTRFRYTQIFRNFGRRAGASLDHPHTQIIALPMVPRWVKEELTCARMHWERTERCLFCDIANQERRDGERLVFENDQFVAFEPFAAKFPFETWILPRRHEADFRRVPGDTVLALAQTLRETLRALARALADPPYNLILHSAPFSAHEAELLANTEADYHWHIEIIPRLTVQAGFEWGTGCHINPVAPETAARALREAQGLG